MSAEGLIIERIAPPDVSETLADLTGILHACVHAGASVGFILPFTPQTATAYWSDQVFPLVRTGDRVLFTARYRGDIVGTAQLGLGLPPNQPHRADVLKLLVHPDRRRLGIARALMQVLISRARALEKSLLVLDTRSGDPSQRLYESLGFQVAGEIPGFCRNPAHETFEPTTYLFKPLTAGGATKI